MSTTAPHARARARFAPRREEDAARAGTAAPRRPIPTPGRAGAPKRSTTARRRAHRVPKLPRDVETLPPRALTGGNAVNAGAEPASSAPPIPEPTPVSRVRTRSDRRQLSQLNRKRRKNVVRGLPRPRAARTQSRFPANQRRRRAWTNPPEGAAPMRRARAPGSARTRRSMSRSDVDPKPPPYVARSARARAQLSALRGRVTGQRRTKSGARTWPGRRPTRCFAPEKEIDHICRRSSTEHVGASERGRKKSRLSSS